MRGGLWQPGEGFARDSVDPARRSHLHYGLSTADKGLEIAYSREVYADEPTYRRAVVMNGVTTQTWDGTELKPYFKEGTHPRLEKTGFASGQIWDKGAYGSHYEWAVRVPWWTIALLMLVPHGFVVARGLRAQRSLDWGRAGRCGDCGYDLRASAERCPECGSGRLEPARPMA
jgi:hypothetical protein